MVQSPSFLITVLAFLLVLGPLVMIHELGHYLVGRWFGVRADAFSIGFGKELTGWTDKRGTRWKLCALPLGGYVQFAGDANAMSLPEADAVHEPGSLHGAKLWHRALIVLAGPLTNLLFALAIYAGFNMVYGKPLSPPEVVAVAPNSDAERIGLQVGDRIVAVGSHKIESANEIAQFVAPFPGRTIALSVERGARTLVIPVKLTPHEVTDDFRNRAVIADLGVGYAVPIIDHFSDGSPAQRSGLQAGDRLLTVAGRPTKSYADIIAAVGGRPGETVAVQVKRAGQTLTFPVKLQSIKVGQPDGAEVLVGRLGVFTRSTELVPVGPVEAVSLAIDQCVGIVRMMVTGIGQILTGERSVKELGGPIKIAKYSGEQFTLGWPQFVWFAALISINLAFINLLPIPALDGGHLAFYAAEAIRRRPVGARGQEWAFRTGMAFVLALMLFVTINDLVSLNLFGR